MSAQRFGRVELRLDKPNLDTLPGGEFVSDAVPAGSRIIGYGTQPLIRSSGSTGAHTFVGSYGWEGVALRELFTESLVPGRDIDVRYELRNAVRASAGARCYFSWKSNGLNTGFMVLRGLVWINYVR